MSLIFRCVNMQLDGSPVISALLLILKLILKCYSNELRILNHPGVATGVISEQDKGAVSGSLP